MRSLEIIYPPWWAQPWAAPAELFPDLSGAILLYQLAADEMFAVIPPIGIAIRQPSGRTLLFGEGTPGHPVELIGLYPPPSWQCAASPKPPIVGV